MIVFDWHIRIDQYAINDSISLQMLFVAHRLGYWQAIITCSPASNPSPRSIT